MTVAGFVTHAHVLGHAYPRHPERPGRLAAILEHLDALGLRRRLVDLTAREATDEEILAVHSAAVIDTQERLARKGGGWADADTFVNVDSPGIARLAAGAVVVATEAVLAGEVRSAFAAVRPPGHHATRDHLMGFCLLNNVAIAAAAALRRGVDRVAIVDWDVHHGNGTQHIFNEDERVLYVSTHAAPFYPGTGHFSEAGAGAARGTKVNIPMPQGAGDKAYTAAYDQVVLPAVERFAPDLILVSCGWDAHARDFLAPLSLSTSGYTAIASKLMELADAVCGGRVVAALEGGYDTHALAWCSSALVELMLGDTPTPDPEPVAAGSEPDIEPILRAVRREVGLD
ncbi:MAG: histone deacetylase [Dehalococcoidia bacterium]